MSDAGPGSRYGDGTGVLAVAHRGGAALGLENTAAAFQLAVDLGYRYLETDVRATTDGVCIAFHDADLHRLTGVRGATAARTWAQVRDLRVLGRAPVPRLEDLLASWPEVHWMLDVKQPSALPSLVRAIRDCGAAERVCLSGTWDRWLDAARRDLGPSLRTALGWRSLGELLCSAGGHRPQASFAHVPLRLGGRRLPSRRLVRRAHARGLRLLVWGVDDAREAHRLLDDDVDGIITDRTDLLREVLIARGAWRPRERRPGVDDGATGRVCS